MNSTTAIVNQPPSDKSYILAHQNVCITEIDFVDRTLTGFVELQFVPLKLNVTKLKLNAKQCQIVRLLARGSGTYYPCQFTYSDPLLEVVQVEPPPAEGQLPASSEKTLKKFNNKHADAVYSTEPDFGNGEIIINLPDEVQKEVSEGSTFRIFIEYLIEKPTGGLHFVVPPDEEGDPTDNVNLFDSTKDVHDNNSNDNKKDASTTSEIKANASGVANSPNNKPQDGEAIKPIGSPTKSDTPQTNGVCEKTVENHSPSEENVDADGKSKSTAESLPATEDITKTKRSKYSHVFTYKNHNSSRTWFPCIDSYGYSCSWLLEFTVESHMTVVSCGDLIGTYQSPDRKKKTYKYELNIPTSAPNIGFVAGQFEVYVDPQSVSSNCQIKNYHLTGLKKLAQATCSFLNDCAEFYEDFLTFKYPYSNYKQVFVDQAYEPHQSYATLSISTLR